MGERRLGSGGLTAPAAPGPAPDLLTTAEIAVLYGVSTQTINCGPSSWIRRGMPVAGGRRAPAGKVARLFRAEEVARWHAATVGRRIQRKPVAARITTNGRLLLSSGAVRLVSGRPDLPLGGDEMLFAVALGAREIRVVYAGKGSPRPALLAVFGSEDWVGVLRPTVVNTSTYLRPPVAERVRCRLFGAPGPLAVDSSEGPGGLVVLRLSREARPAGGGR